MDYPSSDVIDYFSIAPAHIIKGENVISKIGENITHLGTRPLIVGGEKTLPITDNNLRTILKKHKEIAVVSKSYSPECSETSLKRLTSLVHEHKADVIIGVGGGKALDMAKILAYCNRLPIVTIPTSGATCAAWTALSNIYTHQGIFKYDVSLSRCPDILILDYSIIRTAPQRTLIAGIGDAIAKWYEASISLKNVNNRQVLTMTAIQQAKTIKNILLQKSYIAINNIYGKEWFEVVDACILLAGIVSGLGGSNCRTVAAHAVHNGLTNIKTVHTILHGEKVAYGILVQLRLEEIMQNSQLAAISRQQLLKFYQKIGLPRNLKELGLDKITKEELNLIAQIICRPDSDIHRLPFTVSSKQLLLAMRSTAQ